MTSRIVPDVDTSFSKIVKRLLDSMGTHVDGNAGSIARTLAEAYAREMATFYAMLELSHDAGYLDTAKGGALDNVVALLGIERARAGRLTGYVELSRTAPAPDDIGVHAGFRVTGSDDARATPIFATTTDAVIRRGETRVVVAVQEVDYDPAAATKTPVVNPGALTLMIRPVLGVEAVTNPAPLRRGSADESDDDLRARARVALRESEQGTLEAIAVAVRKAGVRQVTVREPEGGPPGVVEVVVGDRDFAPESAPGVERAIRESKAAGIRVELLYASTVYFQPRFEVEPADPNLDDAGFDRLQRALADELVSFGARLPVGETIRRRRLEAALFGNAGVRNLGDIRMRTFVDRSGKGDLVVEVQDRERGAARDWTLRPLETAVFDLRRKPPEITRMRPPTYRFALVIVVAREDRRPKDDVCKAVRQGLDAYAGWLGKGQRTTVLRKELASKLEESAGFAELRSVIVTDAGGLSTELLDGSAYPLAANARLELGSVEVVRAR
jgi:uncharacterized phage protein gp47/JayE